MNTKKYFSRTILKVWGLVFASIFLLNLNTFAQGGFSFDFKNAIGGKIEINGFTFDSQNIARYKGKAFFFCLKSGVNSVYISSIGPETYLKIGRWKEDDLLTAYSLKKNPKGKGNILTEFYLSDFDYKWSWENADEVEKLTKEDEIAIAKLIDQYITAYKTGNLDDRFYEIIRFQLADMLTFRKKLKNIEKIKKSFKKVYSIMLSPDVRKDFTLPQSALKIEKAKLNDKIIRVSRKGSEPIFIIKDATENDYEITSLYVIKVGSKWYII